MRKLWSTLLLLFFMGLSFIFVYEVEHLWTRRESWDKKEAIIEAITITVFSFIGVEAVDFLRARKAKR